MTGPATVFSISMEIDNVFLEIGESGRQQVKYVAVLCLLKVRNKRQFTRLNNPQAYASWLIIQYTFVGREASFSCSRDKESLTNACFDDQVDSTSSTQ